MPHTEGRYQQDLGFPDARIFVTPQDISAFGTAVLTRDSAGLASWHQAASLTNQYIVNVTEVLAYRTGFGEDLQEQFGPSNPNSPAATAIAASAQPQFYRPDLGIITQATAAQLNPRTANKLKGIRVKSYDVIYLISTLALTSHTTTVVQSSFANNVAIASTVVLASGANGLATAVQANPYVTNVSVAPPAGGGYLVTPDTEYGIEVVVVTPATSTYILYGIEIVFDFNYN